jgi:hypothetical protein
VKSIARFLSVVLTALALVPVGAHALEFARKMALARTDYFVVQSIYNGWAALGAVIFAAILANGWAMIARRSEGFPAWLNGTAMILLLVTLAVFFIWTQPANVATRNWTVQPDNWSSLRQRWEYSHAANAVITFAALCCAVAAAGTGRTRGPVPR